MVPLAPRNNEVMNSSSHPDPELFALLQDLWKKHLPSTRERLDILDHAVQIASDGHLDEIHRAEAQSVAHKLSGNLGMFGYKEAGEIASDIEHIFKAPTPRDAGVLSEHLRRLHELLASYL
jgi:HPt (histidine-containing phosphotransfer) domain-containing protein